MPFYLRVSRKMTVGVALVVACTCSFSCKKKEEEPAPAAMSEGAAAPATVARGSAAKGEPAEPERRRKVILNHSLNLEVTTLSVSMVALTKLVESSGGYIFKSSRYSRDENLSSGEVGIRVPVNGAGNVLTGIRSLGRVTNENSTAEDITESYVDMEARLKNTRSSEARLTELYRKAGKLSDVLEIEKELTRVRGEIEAFETKKKNWDLLTQMVTIDVRMEERAGGFPSAIRIWTPIRSAFGQSLVTLADSLHGLIIFLSAVIPWLVVLGPLAYWGVRWRRKMRRGKQAVGVGREPVSGDNGPDTLP